jgi:phosphoglucosamine mutase
VTWSPEAVRFGTDGLRARAGEPPIDPESLRRIGAALGVLLQQRGTDPKRVLLGNDGRDSAPWIVEALAQGLAAADAAVSDIGLCTSPALALLVRTQPFDAAVMVSASHNPAADNGIKIFGKGGGKLDDRDERQIETLAAELRPSAPHTPRIRDRADLLRNYEEHLANTFAGLDLAGLRIAVDAANGGGSALAPAVLAGFGAEVLPVACEPDGFNINAGVGATHPEFLVARVRETGAHLGLALDGDGDRGIFVDQNGTVRDGDDQLCAFALWLDSRGELPHRTVVTTVMSNLGLHKALQAAGVRVLVTDVGDRHVVKAMRAGGYTLGGEPSGHLLFGGAGHLAGDGLYTALQLLSLPGLRERGAAAAFAAFRRFPQRLQSVRVAHKPDLDSVPAIAERAAAVRRSLGDDGRLVLRYSGTEPLCRVMVEGADAAQVQRLCDDLADLIAQELGA